MRIKPIFTITLSLTALLLVGCSQQDTSPSAPEIASVSLVKGGNGGGGGKPDGGGAAEATFAVTFSGDVRGSHKWTQTLSSGASWIGTPYNVNPTLDLVFAEANCFDEPTYTGPLQIREAKNNADHSAEAWLWFEAKGTDEETNIVYLLKMFGNFDGPWLPDVGETNTVTLDAWEMGIEGNKYKSIACTDNDLFSASVLVERLAP